MSIQITWFGVGLAVIWFVSILLAYMLGREVGIEDEKSRRQR